MVFNILLGLMMFDGVILTAVVLMQAGQGGGLASLGGGTASSVLGGRQATTVLTKTTWITGGLFMTLALILSTMSGSRRAAASDLQESLRKGTPPVTQTAPATGGGAVNDLLNNQPAAPAGAAPQTPPTGGATQTPPAGGGGKPDPVPGKKP